MTEHQPQTSPVQPNGRFKWGIVVLILGVLIIASFAFGRSDAEEANPTPSEEAVFRAATTETSMASDSTAETVIVDLPPSPNEVGYTDGIIFLATILVLILLVGTLREVVQRKGV